MTNATVKIEKGPGAYTIAESRHAGGYGSRKPLHRCGQIKARCVADKRDDHHAQIELHISTVYANRISETGIGMSFTRDDALAMARALVGPGYIIKEA